MYAGVDGVHIAALRVDLEGEGDERVLAVFGSDLQLAGLKPDVAVVVEGADGIVQERAPVQGQQRHVVPAGGVWLCATRRVDEAVLVEAALLTHVAIVVVVADRAGTHPEGLLEGDDVVARRVGAAVAQQMAVSIGVHLQGGDEHLHVGHMIAAAVVGAHPIATRRQTVQVVVAVVVGLQRAVAGMLQGVEEESADWEGVGTVDPEQFHMVGEGAAFHAQLCPTRGLARQGGDDAVRFREGEEVGGHSRCRDAVEAVDENVPDGVADEGEGLALGHAGGAEGCDGHAVMAWTQVVHSGQFGVGYGVGARVGEVGVANLLQSQAGGVCQCALDGAVALAGGRGG